MIIQFLYSVGGKKFIIAGWFVSFVMIVSTVLLCIGKIDAAQWLVAIDKAGWAAGGYIGLNVVQKIGDAFGDRKIPPGTP